MSATHAVEGDQPHTKLYLTIGAALFVLTVVTVAAAWIEMPFVLGIGVGLMIAIVKGSLVALYFMHLTNERKLIYVTLLLTFIFFVALLILPAFAFMDSYGGGSMYVP